MLEIDDIEDGKAAHRVAMHHLVAARKAAGQPVWERIIRLNGIWRDDELTFEEKRDRIAAIFKGNKWLEQTEDTSLADFVEELGDAGNEEDFCAVMQYILEIADWDRVWIEN